MRLPRMTTRRWMVAVGVTAIFTASCVQAHRWWRLRTEYDGALRRYESSMTWYLEGRLTAWDLVGISQRLMETELALLSRRDQQVRAVNAHLQRVSRMIDEERRAAPTCHDWPAGDAAFIEDALTESKDKWETWIDASEVDAALTECRAKLEKLRTEGRSIRP
jgi:hypothetical protein